MTSIPFPTLNIAQQTHRYLQNKDFGVTMMIAAGLHLVAVLAILFWPKPDVLEIPVRTLDITLGAGDMAGAAQPAAKMAPALPIAIEPPSAPPAEPVKIEAPSEESFTPAAEKPKVTPKEAPKPKPAPKAKPKETKKPEPAKRIKVTEQQKAKQASIPANVPSDVKLPKVYPPVDRMQGAAPTDRTDLQGNQHQYVRKTRPSGQNGGSPDGQPSGQNTEDIVARYEQKISAWLEQNRVFPAMAKQLGQHGTPVMRVRIDRSGSVKYYAVDRSSGFQLIDEAAMQMVRRANPFPAPPSNYPGAGMMEFLIPVKFGLR